MKNFFLVLLVLTLFGLSLFANGSAQSGGKEKIRVVTYFAGSDQWVPAWKAAIAEFQTLNPNVEILDESQPTGGSNDLFRTKIQTEISAKTPGDVLLFYNGVDAEVITDSGLYTDWLPYLKADQNWAKNIKPGAMESGKTKSGTQICIPYLGYFEGLFYNKAMFDKYNLKEPTTWQNILDAVNVFKQNGVVSFAQPVGRGTGYMIEGLVLAQVGPEGQKKYFDDSWAPAIEAIKTLYDKGAFPADTWTSTDAECRTLFADGKAAMLYNGSWCVNANKDNKDIRIIALPALPGGKGGETTTVAGFGSGWYLSQEAAKRSDNSLKFVKWITSPDQIKKFLAYGGSSAIICDAPEGATPLEISAVEMLNKAVNTRPSADSQVIREAWVKMTSDGIPAFVKGQFKALDVLKTSRDLNNKAQ